MKLTAFRVAMYKGIRNSDWVDVGDLTVFVGKNESGKTTLLRALLKLNPFKPDPYDMAREWPRGYRGERDKNTEVCRARFLLSDVEKTELLSITALESFPDTIEVSRDYAGRIEVHLENLDIPARHHPDDMDRASNVLPESPGNISAPLSQLAASFRGEARRFVLEGRYSQLAELANQQEQRLREHIAPTPPAQLQQDTNFVALHVNAVRALEQSIGSLPTLRVKAHDYIVQHMPTFIYMDDHKIFEGTAILDQLKSRRDSRQPTPADGTLLTILGLSSLNLDDLVKYGQGGEDEVEQRQYDLADGAATLTREITGRFRQRKYEVEFRIDGQRFFTFVKDDRDPSLIRLEERSKGFQWFFSFDLTLMHESQGTFKNCVILLDEPGLHLHPHAQRDLLSRLEHYATGNTLLYTTHLPFMIDLSHPDRIRVLKETSDGVKVTTNLAESPPEAKLVLQAALGMDASQSLLVASQNVVVEGVDDYWVLTELSNLLRRSGKAGLPDGVIVTPGGGASEAVYLATFMIGQGLQVLALFDSDQAGRTAKSKLEKSWLTMYGESKSEAALLGDIIGAKGDFAIEDLFPEDFMVSLVHEAFEKHLTLAGIKDITLPKGNTLSERIEQFGKEHSLELNKGPVAKRLRARLSSMKSLGDLPELTKTHATKLMERIRKSLQIV